MGKLVANFFITLDGVVDSPDWPKDWHFPFYNHEMAAAVQRSQTASAFLMGRGTYDTWVGYWPDQARIEPADAVRQADDFASFINAVPKYVVSDTLRDPEWQKTTVITRDAAAVSIRWLKERADGEIHMAGSATLVRWLLAQGLLDEIHLMIHPVIVGNGRRLFENAPRHDLELVHQETFTTGVIDAVYAVTPTTGGFAAA
jgi:dihydrofolate reductase